MDEKTTSFHALRNAFEAAPEATRDEFLQWLDSDKVPSPPITDDPLPWDDDAEVHAHEVLTPESPRWEQFIAMLDIMLGSGCDGDAGDLVHRHAKAVMTAMGGIDIEAGLDFFESRGGYCDCEILLNVVPSAPVDPVEFERVRQRQKIMIGLLPIQAMRETGSDNEEIAMALRFMADLLELREQNPF
jgi:hypothetical protein